jgi:hypothetical protein
VTWMSGEARKRIESGTDLGSPFGGIKNSGIAATASDGSSVHGVRTHPRREWLVNEIVLTPASPIRFDGGMNRPSAKASRSSGRVPRIRRDRAEGSIS